MEKNILVIGNGYDLAHGLNTRYDDFIEYIRKAKENANFITNETEREFINECIENNGFIKYFLYYENMVNGWIDLENMIKDIIDNFNIFFNYCQDVINKSCNFSINLDSSYFDHIKANKFRSCILLFPIFARIESHYKIYKKYYTRQFGLNKREILRLLKSQLDDVIKLLKIYLENIMDEKYNDLNMIRQIEAIEPSYVISFNYTDTYKIYGIKPEDVFHVHGSLDKDNMVLGFNDDNEENLDFVYFKKYFQRIQKLTGYIDREKFLCEDALGQTITNQSIIHFYGHSMDKTDGDIIEKLFSMSKGFVIYTYNQEDYEQKVINLIDVFGKELATQRIQNGIIKFVQCEN